MVNDVGGSHQRKSTVPVLLPIGNRASESVSFRNYLQNANNLSNKTVYVLPNIYIYGI